MLRNLLRIFNRDALRNATGDVFGRIYEYFLNKFAMTGAQEGGEFFTPPSLVRLIVNVIEPDHGKVFDCAAGRAGMFVQTGYFLERRGQDPSRTVTFCGLPDAGAGTGRRPGAGTAGSGSHDARVGGAHALGPQPGEGGDSGYDMETVGGDLREVPHLPKVSQVAG